MTSDIASGYLLMRRWETRLVIAWIVMISIGVLCLFVSMALAQWISLLTIAIGVLLYLLLSSAVSPTYSGTTGAAKMIFALPPMMISALFFGVLDRWMRRVGFGVKMRVGVTSLALVAVATPWASPSALVLLLMCGLTSALMRVRFSSAIACIPSALALLIIMAGR